MEVYILDSLYRRVDVVDKFESVIWTERFSAWGDVELLVHSTPANRKRFLTGTKLACNESYRVMTVETIEDTTDDEGKKLLKIKGPSLEYAFEHRVARGSLSDLTTEPKWVLTGKPADIARKMFHDICVAGILDPADVIPMVIEGSIFPEGTIPEPDETITYEVEPKSLYEALKELCDIYNLGFRLVRNFDSSQLYFDIYTGSDRTTQQTTLPAVVFSPSLDNLTNTTELTTTLLYKNVAYVISPVGHEVVYSLDFDPTTNGFDRRVLLVKADDITDEDPLVASAKMIQKGKEELAKHRRLSAFDGELTNSSKYKYGIDYNLGDLVELRNEDGVTNKMRVTEQIFVSDKEGERSYPTLTLEQFVMPGTWLDWKYNKPWEEFDVTEYWNNQP